MKSLADTLGIVDPPREQLPSATTHLEHLTGKEFAEAVLDSLEFRKYICEGVRFGTIPSAILVRLIDHGWGKPPDRIEHTGKDGKPIETTVTEVRRVVVRVPSERDENLYMESHTTH
jgi:hypothetical protein